MKVLIAGKFPPIQGGTSVYLFWLVWHMAKMGNSVTVVDLPDAYAPYQLCNVSAEDWHILRRRYGDVDFRLVNCTTDLDSAWYIPTHEPLVTRLINALLVEAEREPPDALVANYMEPYGVAVAHVAEILGIPYGVIHAGSDLWRLAGSPDRQAAYRSILGRADLVLSSPTSAGLAQRRGARVDSIVIRKPILSPASQFTPEGPCLPTNSGFTVGVFGKLGTAKGGVQLLDAVAALKTEGHDVNVRVLTGLGGPNSDRFIREAEERGLADRVECSQFMAPWRVDEYLRSCSAIAFLEHGFPVDIHRPQIPREAAACGVPLVVSREISYKQFSHARSQKGVYVVADPISGKSVADCLRPLLEDENLPSKGLANSSLYKWPEPEYVENWVKDLLRQLSIAKDIQRSRHVALQHFQDAAMSILADPNKRRQLKTEPATLREGPALDSDERGALEALLRDPNLERYCQGLQTKRLNYLHARFGSVLNSYPNIGHMVELRFRELPLTDSPLADRFEAFRDLCASVGAELLDAASFARFSSRLEYAYAKAVCTVDDTPVVDYRCDPVRLNPTTHILHLQERLLDAGADPGEGSWVVVWKDGSGRVRSLEVARAIQSVLFALADSPVPLHSLGEQLGAAAGVSDVEVVNGTISNLIEKQLLVGASEGAPSA